jgi:purine nucleoside permease
MKGLIEIIARSCKDGKIEFSGMVVLRFCTNIQLQTRPCMRETTIENTVSCLCIATVSILYKLSLIRHKNILVRCDILAPGDGDILIQRLIH